jgi:hypothetical protein
MELVNEQFYVVDPLALMRETVLGTVTRFFGLVCKQNRPDRHYVRIELAEEERVR